MRTSCEYKPVHSTRRNSPDSLGKLVVILGKYAISCLGGSSEGFLNDIVEVKGRVEQREIAEAVARAELSVKGRLTGFKERRREDMQIYEDSFV